MPIDDDNIRYPDGAPVPDEKPIPITPVSNYRKLSQEEIDLMNEAVKLEEQVLAFYDKLRERGRLNWGKGHERAHPRWLAIGRTQIEQGFMALRRAVAKPGRDQQEVLDMSGAVPD